MAQEYQDGAIADDGNGNYMVRRGGLWHRSNEKGYPLERIARPDYGDRYYQQPNGDIVREGPRGGFEVVERAGGGGGGNEPLVGADARARFMAGLGPLKEAQANFTESEERGNPLNRDWGAALIDNATEVPFLRTVGDAAARIIGGEDYQKYAQAASTYESALLPILSGAAVTPSEAARLIRADLPQIGDSEEVLQRKARNRALRINAVARGIGQPEPYDLNNLSTESEERALGAIAGAAGGDAGPSQPTPPEGPVDISGMSAADLLKLTPGTAIRLPDGTVTRLTGAPSIGAEGREVSPGVFARETPEQVAEARREDTSTMRQVDAGVRGAADFFTAGLADEIAAGANTVLPLDRGSVSGFTRGFGDAYRQNLEVQRGVDRADEETAGAARLTGQVAGGLAFAPRAIAQGGARIAAATGRQAVRAATRQAARRGAVEGAAYGGAYGFGSAEGNAVERAPNAIGGAATGAATGLVAAPVANALGRTVINPLAGAVASGGRFAGRMVGRAGTALGVPGAERVVQATTPNALRSGLGRFADRMGPERVNALRPELARQADLGMDSTLIDIADDASVGRIRALGTRDTPARDQLVRFTEGRRARLPSRVRRMATEEISDDVRPTPEVIDDLARQRRDNATGIQGFGNDPVDLNENIVAAMRGPTARQALRDASERAASSLDPEERAAAPMLAALAQGGPASARLSVREIQDISAALRKSADAAFRTNPADGPVLSNLGNAIRQAGRTQSDAYGEWLGKYADDSSLLEAATTGRNFVSVSADPVAERSTQAFVRNAERATAPELEVQRQASGQAVQAASSSPSGARGFLDKMAFDEDQIARARAIGTDADRLQQRSQVELRNLTQAQRASPRIGSESITNAQDAAGAAGVMGAIRRPLDAAASTLITRVRSRGFNDNEARAVVEAAIDPARTQEVIDILAQRMSRREARNLARVIRRQVTIGLQSGQQQ